MNSWYEWKTYDQPLFWDIYSTIINALWIFQNYSGMEVLARSPFESIGAFLKYFYAAIINVSWPIWHFTIPSLTPYQYILVFYGVVMMFALIFDFLTLSKIAENNTKNHAHKPAYNKTFIGFFLFARLWLMDIFLFSSLGAHFLHMRLSKKQILILIFVTQLLRLGIFLVLYFLVYDYYDPSDPYYWKFV